MIVLALSIYENCFDTLLQSEPNLHRTHGGYSCRMDFWLPRAGVAIFFIECMHA